MAKVALLIGVSEYEEPSLTTLPGASKDVEAMQRVLQNPEVGGFDKVSTLFNPDPFTLQEAIETLFSGRAKDDLVLFFLSGHGIKDESGRLYFATRITRKNQQGELLKATAVPARFMHDIMSNSRSKRQVVILDCCFSGAFAEGWLAKDDGSVDVKSQIGGEGRAVLTSSTSTQYSFEQEGSDLSIYTRYLVEGIETGAADRGNDGSVSIDELHEYAKKKVQEAAPAMKPEIYAIKEGYKIHVAKASIGDPRLRYRKEVERFANRGEISFIARNALDVMRDSLGLLPEDTSAIEAEVLKPYQERKRKLQQYEQVLIEAVEHENPLSENTRKDLQSLHQVLGLRDEDVAAIETRIIVQKTPVSSLDKIAESPNNPNILKDENFISVTSPHKATTNESETNAHNEIKLANITSTFVPVLRKNKILIIGAGMIAILALTFSAVMKNQEMEIYNKGVTKYDKKDYKGAIEYFDQVLKRNPNFKDKNVYLKRGYAHSELRNYNLCTNDLKEYITTNSEISSAYNILGYCYHNLEQYDKAISNYNKAIKFDSKFIWAYPNRAKTYSQKGDKDAAIQDYQTAAELYRNKGETENYQKMLAEIAKLQQ